MNDINHKFRIAEQFGLWGYYCEVTLRVVFLARHELQVTCDSPEWKTAAEFGIEYAWEHIGVKMDRGIAVHIVELQTHPVDSSMSVVAYATAMCLIEAVGFTGESTPKFQKEEAKFCFLK